jgi:hypothetical protein
MRCNAHRHRAHKVVGDDGRVPRAAGAVRDGGISAPRVSAGVGGSPVAEGSYFVPLTAVAALLRSKTPFFLRETLQRALVDADGRVVDDFADARIVRDSTKRARGLSQLEAQDERVADAQAHWTSLRNLLRAIDAVFAAAASQYDYLEIPPCHCASCRKHGKLPCAFSVSELFFFPDR